MGLCCAVDFECLELGNAEGKWRRYESIELMPIPSEVYMTAADLLAAFLCNNKDAHTDEIGKDTFAKTLLDACIT